MKKKIMALLLIISITVSAVVPCLAWTEGTFVGSDGYYFSRKYASDFLNPWTYGALLYDNVGTFAFMHFGYKDSTDFDRTKALVSNDSSYATIQQGTSAYYYGSLASTGTWSSKFVSHGTTPVTYYIDWVKSHTTDLYAYVNHSYASEFQAYMN